MAHMHAVSSLDKAASEVDGSAVLGESAVGGGSSSASLSGANAGAGTGGPLGSLGGHSSTGSLSNGNMPGMLGVPSVAPAGSAAPSVSGLFAGPQDPFYDEALLMEMTSAGGDPTAWDAVMRLVEDARAHREGHEMLRLQLEELMVSPPWVRTPRC